MGRTRGRGMEERGNNRRVGEAEVKRARSLLTDGPPGSSGPMMALVNCCFLRPSLLSLLLLLLYHHCPFLSHSLTSLQVHFHFLSPRHVHILIFSHIRPLFFFSFLRTMFMLSHSFTFTHTPSHFFSLNHVHVHVLSLSLTFTQPLTFLSGFVSLSHIPSHF